MKEHEWLTPNRMKFDSGHKEFNRQVDCISTGNVLGNVQYSRYIRPYGETECNGLSNPPGHLQEFDLKWLKQFLPCRVVEEAKKLTHEQGGIFYEFHHRSNGKRISHGAILTTRDHKKIIKIWFFRPGWKSESIMLEAAKYVIEEE